MSPELAAARERFRPFLIADDVLRGETIERSDTEMLAALADTIYPLLDEINAVLDRLEATPHPLPDDQAHIEDELNSLAQAAIEARMEADDRV